MARETNNPAPQTNEVAVVKVGQMSNGNYYILLQREKANAFFGNLIQRGFIQTTSAPTVSEGDIVPASALVGLNIQWQQ